MLSITVLSGDWINGHSCTDASMPGMLWLMAAFDCIRAISRSYEVHTDRSAPLAEVNNKFRIRPSKLSRCGYDIF